MMDFLRFTFSDGWHFAGVVLLVWVVGYFLAAIAWNIRARR